MARIGFIGSGRIAERIARNLLTSISPTPSFCYTSQSMTCSLSASDPLLTRRTLFSKMGFFTTVDNARIWAACDIVILAVNSSELSTCWEERRGGCSARQDQVVLSLAGTYGKDMVQVLPPDLRNWQAWIKLHANAKRTPTHCIPPKKCHQVNFSKVECGNCFHLGLKKKRPTGLPPEIAASLTATKSVVPMNEVRAISRGVAIDRSLSNFQSKVIVGRQSGVKVILKYASHDEMKMENEILNVVRHPNVVTERKTHAPSLTDDVVVLEFINGETLSDRIRRGKLSERQVQRIARELVGALAHLHAHGYVHRDLKLENIMMETKTGRSVLIDFGMAVRLHYEGEKCTTFCGSLGYVSPEMAAGRTYTTSTDIWSLGVVFYMCLTGKAPFASHEKCLLLKHIQQGIVPVQVLKNAQVSRQGVEFVTSMLQINATRRWTATQLLQHPWLL